MADPDHFIPGCIEITLRATQEGSARINVWHYFYSPGGLPPSVSDLTALAQQFWGFISPSYKAITSTSVNFDYVTARDLNAEGAYIGTFTPAQPQAGTGTGDFTPGNAASVISWRTGIAARWGRGRTFVFGIPEAVTLGSTVTATQVAGLTSLGNAIRNFVGAGSPMTVQFVVASFVHELLMPVVAYVADIYIDSQRRRLINRGR